MSIRSLLALIFVSATTVMSAMYYEFYLAVEGMARVALIETGNTSYYPPENHFDVAVRIVIWMSVFTLLGIAAILLLLYIISRVVCNRRVQAVILELEDIGTDFSVTKHCHWHGFSWSVSCVLLGSEKYTRSSSEDYFEEVPFVHS